MLNTVFNEHYHRSYYNGMPELTTKIDQYNYLGWPTQGMCEWTYNCPMGPNGHFLEKGHQLVADKIYEHIGNRGWVS